MLSQLSAVSSAVSKIAVSSAVSNILKILSYHRDAGIMALTDLTKWHNTTLVSISVEHNGCHEALFSALTRTVTSNIAPPARIRYQFDPVKYQLRNRIRNNKPSLGGTAPFEWSVYPPLPRGLEFDETTGTISGVPLCYCPPRFYSVSAKNSAGECTVS